MPAFIEQFAASVRSERQRLALAFGPAAADRQEELLQSAVQAAWRPLNPSAALSAGQRPVFATDGSQAIRHFNNGWGMIVCHALCVGPEFESPSVDVRFVRSTVPESVLARYAGLMMRYLEVRAALDNVDRAAGGVICLDGSLHAMLPHLVYPLASDDASDLPLAVLESYLDLIDACAERDVLLLSLSKTSTGSFLGEALLALDERSGVPSDPQGDPSGPLPSDIEVLYRWTQGAGYTRPLVLGTHGFGHRRGQLLAAPEQLVGAFETRRYEFDERLALFDRLAYAPATVSTYIRMRPGEDPVRIDVPAASVGIDDGIRDTYMRWADAADFGDVLAHLSGAYGGRSVYHAALYVADRLVRLHNATVDSAYLSIVRAQFGAFVQYDRSRRRFI